MMKQAPETVSQWRGKPIDELSREELVEALNWCGRELQEIRADRTRWMRSADPVKYLLQGRVK
jgi:hypothetical protein